MSPEELQERGRGTLGPRFLSAIACRLRVDARHVEAWASGRAEIPERHAEAIERLLAAQGEADQLVARWIEALHRRANEENLDRADILAAIARRPEIGAACAAASSDARATLTKRT